MFKMGFSAWYDNQVKWNKSRKEFVKINKGKLEIFSHEGYALIKNVGTYCNTPPHVLLKMGNLP